MRLRIELPAGWTARPVDDGVLHEAPGQAYGILVLPMAAAPVDPDAWIQRAFMYGARPEDGAPHGLTLGGFTTDGGWSGVLVEGELGAQARFVAYLGLLDYAVTLIAMCRDPDAHPGWRDDALGLIRAARPDFGDDRVAALAGQLGAAPGPVRAARPRISLQGWSRRFVGGDLVLTGPDPAAGAIRISPHLSPVRAVSELFAAYVTPAPDTTIDGPFIDTTDEGEYAAVASAVGPTGARVLGIVFGDDHYARIEAAVADPAQLPRFQAGVHELLFATTLGLGAGRWRRYYYDPPAGWSGIARPRSTLWISPSCPRQYQVARVFDARPPADHARLHGTRMFEALPMEFYRAPPKGPVSYWTADGLECQVSVYTGRLPGRAEELTVLDGAVLSAEYTYPIRIECDAERREDSLGVFERIVASLRPVPARRAGLDADVSAVAFWAD